MSIQIQIARPTQAPRRHTLAKAWRNWWLRAAKRRQMQRLHDVVLDPHMARDLGLPTRERPALKIDLW